jgi:hypothetical protein
LALSDSPKRVIVRHDPSDVGARYSARIPAAISAHFKKQAPKIYSETMPEFIIHNLVKQILIINKDVD